MNIPKSHDQHRTNVCAICYDENGKRVARPVCPAEEEIIQKSISHDFSTNKEKFATGLCIPCRIDLWKLSRKVIQSIYVSKNFGAAILVHLRSGKCQCVICDIGRLAGPIYKLQTRKWKEERPNRVMFFPDFDSVDEQAVPDDAQQNPDPDDLPPHHVHDDQTLELDDHSFAEPLNGNLQIDDVHERAEDVRDPALHGPVFICPETVPGDDTGSLPGSDTEPVFCRDDVYERADDIQDPTHYGPTFICPEVDPGDTESVPGSDTSQPVPGSSHSAPVTLNELDAASFCSSCHNELDIQDEILGVQQNPNNQREESVVLDASGDSRRTDMKEPVQEESSSSSSNQNPDPALRPSITKDRDLCSNCFSKVLIFKRIYFFWLVNYSSYSQLSISSHELTSSL